MKAATRDWIKKAEADYQLAVSLMRRKKIPVYDHACVLFQQSAEKYLKARLEEAGVRFPKTHDLVALLQLAAPLEPLWAAFTVAARKLNNYAVQVRYPGNEATGAEMKTSHRDSKAIRAEARAVLGLG